MINNDQRIYIGIVEDRHDHLQLGRCRVRIAGLHTHDTDVLPTKDLPWAMIMHPLSADKASALPPVEGTAVLVMFLDHPQNQQPVVMGKLSGIPQDNPVTIDTYEAQPLFKDYLTPEGRTVPTNRDEAEGVVAAGKQHG